MAPSTLSPTVTVHEEPLVLEPVTHDPFIDELDGLGVITPQRALVQASLLRLGDREERS
jgi:hypothetical protein